ncbi:MAG: isochorismatase family protein, partial [Erysipelotrichaceae bacterium]|nr:isochorismatase family protein [Erysipelotrichaceae bacterium]
LQEYDEIILTGVQAEVCVLSTAYGLIDLGKKVVYKRSLIAGRNKEKKEAAEKVLSSMSPLHVRFID